ncbi:hypothetical protein AB0B94_31075 [Micromonospora sp. NPDC048986]|uniref:hypothetical protein n=1 Tax=Micromonospora sp. NPDC048986 TaxID=3155644 RepID=UPI0033F2C5A7
MIKRAPRPVRRFTVLSDDVLRDPNLTYRAAGVLHDILSRPDNWTATAESLAAARPGKEGVKALRTALRELEAVGYLKRERIRLDDGRFTWVQTVFDAPVSDTKTEDSDVSAGQTTSPKPPGGFPPDGNGPSKEVPRRSTYLSEVQCTAASGVGDDGHEDDYEAPKPNDWRSEDRAEFKALLGETIDSAGVSGWNQGRFPVDAVYDALRQGARGRKRVEWPGRYLSTIDGTDPISGVASWLDNQGFELVS